MNEKDKIELTESYEEWACYIPSDVFLQEIQALIDGVMCGKIKKSDVDKWLKSKDHKLDWENLSLISCLL